MSEVKKILIVEDEIGLLKVLVTKFTQEGYKVSEAKNGEEGLELAFLRKPDIILLDLVMPVMDGMTMLKKLREDKWGGKVPVFILTNLSEAEKVSEATGQGVYDFLVKADWHINDVVDKVRQRLGK